MLFRDAPQNGPKYVGSLPDQPFPLNPLFRSQSVLSEELREEIYHRVKTSKHSLKTVSSSLGVDVRRVAAVVRMKEMEKQWVAEVSFFFFFFGSLPSSPGINKHSMMINFPKFD